jgi:hypothetical protein
MRARARARVRVRVRVRVSRISVPSLGPAAHPPNGGGFFFRMEVRLSLQHFWRYVLNGRQVRNCSEHGEQKYWYLSGYLS